MQSKGCGEYSERGNEGLWRWYLVSGLNMRRSSREFANVVAPSLKRNSLRALA